MSWYARDNLNDGVASADSLFGVPTLTVVALVGLAFEARIAAGHRVFVVCRGDECELSDHIDPALRAGCRSIISFGIAGGLTPHLRPGDVVVASAVFDANTARPTDPVWSRRLIDIIPDAHYGPVVGVNSVVANPLAKWELHERTKAVAVDMESHLVARFAQAHNLAFAAVRVVADPVHRPVPKAALAGMGPHGSTEVMAVLRELRAEPSQLSALLRIALDAYLARSALQRLRRTLGPAFEVPADLDT